MSCLTVTQTASSISSTCSGSDIFPWRVSLTGLLRQSDGRTDRCGLLNMYCSAVIGHRGPLAIINILFGGAADFGLLAE